MTTTHPQTYTHPNPLTTLAPHLLHHLPHSLPLLRRIQFHTSSPSARTIATFPPSSPSPSPPPSSFAATWVDRTRAPLTECWIFSTYETVSAPQHQPQGQGKEEEEAKEAAESQCLALLTHIARSSAPSSSPPRSSVMVIGSLNEKLLPMIGGGEEAVRRLVPQDVVARDLPIRSTNEHGSTGKEEEEEEEEGAAQRKSENKSKSEMKKKKKKKKKGDIITSISIPYRKFLIGPQGDSNDAEKDPPPLPPNYTFTATLPPADLHLALSRTAIPKTVDELAQLGCVGVRYSHPPPLPPPPPTQTQAQPATLIAWSFLSHDGSLSTLHVEPGHRRRGIAKAVCRRLLGRLGADAGGVGFRAVGGEGDGGDGGGDVVPRGSYGKGQGWAHSDVAEGNEESAGVARGVGGREGWRVRWVGVDLGAVAEGRGDVSVE